MKTKNSKEYYDGTKLLSLKDINKKRPEIFIAGTNRSAGKTTYFNRLLVNRFIKNGSKFMLIFRYQYELTDVASKFFSDIQSLFFKDYAMDAQSCAHGTYQRLYLNKNHCGYAVALNSCEQVKKQSHLFSDTTCMLFDEFQSESNRYLPSEVDKLISIHTSVSRGGGQHSRYVPVYLIGNNVTILNPYYIALGISDRLTADTIYLRGDGWVLESSQYTSAEDAQKQSAFNRAFQNTQYAKFSSENAYLQDNVSFIEKMTGYSQYICTLAHNGKKYGVRQYEGGIVYVSKSYDSTNQNKYAINVSDHATEFQLLRSGNLIINVFRKLFHAGQFRFQDAECKNVILELLHY